MPTRQTVPLPDDPLSLHAPRLFRAFGWYLHWFFWRNFHAVRISGAGIPDVPAHRPLMVYANHPSWWDPALFMLLSNTILRDRISFGPMEAEALERYKLFRRFGVYGIDTATQRGAARFMAVSVRILSRPGTALWVTSEGHFTDPRVRPVRLRPGLAHLARRLPDAVIVPLAVEYPFWNERKPEVLFRFGPPVEAGRGRSVAEWNDLLQERLSATMDALALDAMTRNPTLFQRVLRGRVGVGGIYDIWRRLTAVAGWRRPQLAHEQEPEA
nr:lysophospholipid acyltransferase family protein [uncultured Rhodopila sp.]